MSQEDIEYLKRRRSSPGFRRACYRLAEQLNVEIDPELGDMCALLLRMSLYIEILEWIINPPMLHL